MLLDLIFQISKKEEAKKKKGIINIRTQINLF